MPKTIATIYPTTWDTIKKDHNFARAQQVLDPRAPPIREATAEQSSVQTVPVNIVESFVEVKLKDNCWGVAAVATLKEISRIDEAVSDTSPQNKPSLIITDEQGNKRLKPLRKDFRNPLDSRVLKGNGPEILRLSSIFFLGNEVRPV